MGQVIPFPLGELYMKLRDRKRLQRLMIVQGVSARALAREAGWKSHSYMNRLLSGEVETLAPEPALRIAHHLGVGVEDLFLTKVERPAHQSGTHERGSSRFVVNDPAVAGIHATVLAALVSRIRVR